MLPNEFSATVPRTWEESTSWCVMVSWAISTEIFCGSWPILCVAFLQQEL